MLSPENAPFIHMGSDPFYFLSVFLELFRSGQRAAGQGRRGEIQSEACRVWISPRRPCPAAPLTGHGLNGSDPFYFSYLPASGRLRIFSISL